jgi:Kef-type K+ transport system membrane component KefB
MKIKRAVLAGIAIWFLAVLLYSISYYVPLLEDPNAQADIVLFIAVMPLVWFACAYYYKKDNSTHGYKVGQTMLLTGVALDTLITVPFFMIPKGINHFDFFTSLGFWIIAFEFLIVAVLYWYARVVPKTMASKQ